MKEKCHFCGSFEWLDAGGYWLCSICGATIAKEKDKKQLELF
jgi:ribosomal protein L37AE/L43A